MVAKAKMLCDQNEMLFLESDPAEPEISEAELQSLRKSSRVTSFY